MNDEQNRAVVVLLAIAEDEEVEADTRVRAACSILDLTKFLAANEKVPAAG